MEARGLDPEGLELRLQADHPVAAEPIESHSHTKPQFPQLCDGAAVTNPLSEVVLRTWGTLPKC